MRHDKDLPATLSWLAAPQGDADPRTGVVVERLGDLARRLGLQRWKRAPAATGRNVHHLMNHLSTANLAVYSHDGVRAVGANGDIANKQVLSYLHADDLVVVLDVSSASARRVADGRAGLTHEPVPDDVLATYRGDRIRAANHHDVDRVVGQLLLGPLGGQPPAESEQ